MRPLFSCVMPVKGPRPYMEEALASLAAQGMGDDLEVIVQDGDCGERGTGNGERGMGNGERVRWVEEEDCGQADAFNRGFAKARGEWFFWLNADDVLLPGALESVKLKAKSEELKARNGDGSGIEWIVGNQLLIDESSRVQRCSVGPGWHDWLYRHSVPHVYGPSAFFRRELLERVGGFDVSLHFCMDWDLWIRFMKAGARFGRIDRYLWGQRQWPGSKTQRPHDDEEGRMQWSEVVGMMRKNGFSITRGGLLLSRAWRVLNGNYLTEWRDGRRFRGRKANECVG